MFRVVFLGLASGAAMLFATSALAGGDLAPERPFTWTGFYVGGQIGVAINEDNFGDPARVPPTRGEFNANGFIGGGHLGYNIQSGIVVYGIEGDFEWSNASGSGTGFIPVNAPFVTGHLDENWQGSVRARLGIASHRTLFYVTGGVAWGNFDFGYTFPIVGGVTDRFSDTLTGWTVGGGVETVVAGNWTGRIEYRYTDFGHATGSIANCCAPAPNHQRHEIDQHSLRMGLSYRF